MTQRCHMHKKCLRCINPAHHLSIRKKAPSKVAITISRSIYKNIRAPREVTWRMIESWHMGQEGHLDAQRAVIRPTQDNDGAVRTDMGAAGVHES